MSEQFPGPGPDPGRDPDGFDAFSQPAAPRPAPDHNSPQSDATMVFAVAAPEPDGFGQRLARFGRAKAAVAGVAALALIGGGAWAASTAFGASSGSASSPVASAPVAPSAGAAQGARAKKGAKVLRLAITRVGPDTFAGTDAKGAVVTVSYGDDTKFGTTASPLSVDQLAVGVTVAVSGERTGDSVTATTITLPGKAGAGQAGAGKDTAPVPAATPTDGSTS